jgi:hypothetical protein
VETFVVRIWIPDDERRAAPLPLRGVMQHVGSDEPTPFSGDAELVELLRRLSLAARSGCEPRGGTSQ